MFIQCTSEPIAGPEGPQGIQGEQGAQGEQGEQGEQGLGTQVCTNCHSNSHTDPIYDAYAMSAHGSGSSWARGTSADCAQCHNNEGYVDYLSNTMLMEDPRTGELVQGSNPNGYEVSNAITCNGCHNEHRSFDFVNDGNDYAVRNIDAVALVIDPTVEINFANNSDPLGLSNSCTICHQPRNSYYVPGGSGTITITSYRYGPHHGPQATLLDGVMAANIVGSTGYPGAGGNGDNTHRTSSSCTACHMSESTIAEEGGHTWIRNEEACLTCHINGAPDEASGFTADMETLHNLLMADNLIDESGYVLGDDGVNRASSSNPLNATVLQAQAIWNYKTLEEDKSKGVHNPKYTKALLKNTIESLE